MLQYGRAPRPVTTAHGTTLGGGQAVPELNFTLPTMTVDASTRSEVLGHYRQIVADALERAYELEQEAVVFEFETLLEMTMEPELGIELVSIMRGICDKALASRGTKSSIQLTPNDIRGNAFSLVVLGVRDMHFLWKQIVQIAEPTGRVAGGDTARGYEGPFLKAIAGIPISMEGKTAACIHERRHPW